MLYYLFNYFLDHETNPVIRNTLILDVRWIINIIISFLLKYEFIIYFKNYNTQIILRCG